MEEILLDIWKWFIDHGIMTIVSTIVVSILGSVIANFIYTKRKDQRAERAKDEIMATIKPMLVDKCIPNVKVLNSLIRTIARKHNVKVSNLYTKEHLADVMITEVLENSFLSTKDKEEYCKSITEWLKKVGPLESALITSEKILSLREAQLFVTITAYIPILVTMVLYLIHRIDLQSYMWISIGAILSLLPVMVLSIRIRKREKKEENQPEVVEEIEKNNNEKKE